MYTTWLIPLSSFPKLFPNPYTINANLYIFTHMCKTKELFSLNQVCPVNHGSL